MPSCAPKDPGALCSWLLRLNKESGGGLRFPLHFRKMIHTFSFSPSLMTGSKISRYKIGIWYGP